MNNAFSPRPTTNGHSTLSLFALFAIGTVLALLGSPVRAQIALAGNDAPELAPPGPMAVGTTITTISIGNRTSLTPNGPAVATRAVDVRLWYPAEGERNNAHSITYTHTMTRPDIGELTIEIPGIAEENIAPIQGSFPLVVVSHGYGNWATGMAGLAENLASKGYVVAAIEHVDHPFGKDIPQLDFANVVMRRADDQRGVIKGLLALQQANETPALSGLDRNAIGLIGFSMGGFGAVATAGANYDIQNSSLMSMPLPEAAVNAMNAKLPNEQQPDAVILMAPWGAQAPFRVWSDSALSDVTAPTLTIGGDHDDVSNYSDGIRRVFEQMTSSNRYLLTYRLARHNIAADPVYQYSDALKQTFPAIESSAEPVWRTERINAINQHFVTAFLDYHLKGEADRLRFLDVPFVESSQSEWPLPFGQSVGAAFASDEQPKHWPGFQRRWALGMALEHRSGATEAAPDSAD